MVTAYATMLLDPSHAMIGPHVPRGPWLQACQLCCARNAPHLVKADLVDVARAFSSLVALKRHVIDRVSAEIDVGESFDAHGKLPRRAEKH